MTEIREVKMQPPPNERRLAHPVTLVEAVQNLKDLGCTSILRLGETIQIDDAMEVAQDWDAAFPESRFLIDGMNVLRPNREFFLKGE